MKVKILVKKYWEYILAFLIPIVIVLLHCIIRDSWLFGDGSILRGDASVQYIYIYEELWNKVHESDLSFYSWNALGGYDFYLNMLYYTMSPATIVIMLLPKGCLEDAVQFFMVMKWALLSFTTVYFFMHTKFNTLKKNRRFVSLAFGVCYAMGSFFLSMITYFNWMDTFILFPILLLLIEKMVENGKWKMYYICLTIAIVCNFYIAFPMCIFLFLWFLLQIQTTSMKRKKKTLTFLGASLLAGVSSMAVIVPCVANVGSRYTSGKETETVSYIRSILEVPGDIIEKCFVFNPIETNGLDDTAFYMSVGLISLCTLFCFLKMNRKIKYTKLGMAIFLVASLFIGLLDYMWHGFSIPHGIEHRYGFVLILLLLIMALDVLIHVEELKIWQCLLALGINIALFCYTFFTIDVYEEFYVYFTSVMLLIFDFILLILVCKKSIKKDTFIVVFLSLCMLEVGVNAYYQFQFYNMTKPEEVQDVKEAVDLAEDISLEDGQRAVFANAGYNLGLKANMSSMQGFLSYSNGGMNDLISNLGMNVASDAAFVYSGGSPLLNLMFNVGTGVGEYESEFSDCEVLKTGEQLSVYKINRLAGLGYMVEDSVTDWEMGEFVPFETQNDFVKCALGTDDEVFHIYQPDVECFTILGDLTPVIEDAKSSAVTCNYVPKLEQDGHAIKFKADKDMDLYINLQGSTSFWSIVTVDGETIYQDTKSVGQVTIHVGQVKEGQEISIVCIVKGEVGNNVVISAQFAEFDQDVYQAVYENLSADVYQITEMKDDYITGTIHANEDGIMMTSIQVMDGFTVYVDGQQTDYKTVGGALIGVPVQKGEHVVEFRYQTPYAKLGWLVSVCGILTFIIICIAGRKKNVPVFCETESAG